jgi:hypothetical protein
MGEKMKLYEPRSESSEALVCHRGGEFQVMWERHDFRRNYDDDDDFDDDDDDDDDEDDDDDDFYPIRRAPTTQPKYSTYHPPFHKSLRSFVSIAATTTGHSSPFKKKNYRESERSSPLPLKTFKSDEMSKKKKWAGARSLTTFNKNEKKFWRRRKKYIFDEPVCMATAQRRMVFWWKKLPCAWSFIKFIDTSLNILRKVVIIKTEKFFIKKIFLCFRRRWRSSSLLGQGDVIDYKKNRCRQKSILKWNIYIYTYVYIYFFFPNPNHLPLNSRANECKEGDWKNKCYRCGKEGH